MRICLEQKSAPGFITRKLYKFLVSEDAAPPAELIDPLAEQFRKSGYDFGALVKTVLSSNLFFSDFAYRKRIKPPVDFALGIVRGLEGHVGTSNLVPVLEQLGQNVFNPPSVKGWDGGPTWLNGQTLLFRQNLALALTSTEDPRFGARTDPAALVRKHGKKSDEEMLDLSSDRVPAERRPAGVARTPARLPATDPEADGPRLLDGRRGGRPSHSGPVSSGVDVAGVPTELT